MQCRSQIVTAEHAVQPENIHRKIQHPCSTEGRAKCGRCIAQGGWLLWISIVIKVPMYMANS